MKLPIKKSSRIVFDERRVDCGDGSGLDECCSCGLNAGFVISAGQPYDLVAAIDEGLADGLHWIGMAGGEMRVQKKFHLDLCEVFVAEIARCCFWSFADCWQFRGA